MSTDEDKYKICFDADWYDMAFQIAVMAMADCTARQELREAEQWRDRSLECLEFAELTEQGGIKH